MKDKRLAHGMRAEQKVSQEFHREGVALLVSHQVLRKRQLGQIDLAKLEKHPIEGTILHVCEVKTNLQYVFSHQKKRLMRSCAFLGQMLSAKVKLSYQEDKVDKDSPKHMWE